MTEKETPENGSSDIEELKGNQAGTAPMADRAYTGKSPDEAVARAKIIIKTSLIGIGANVLLAVFKALVGFAVNSIAIVLDAVNNLSDAVSSIVTIIGTKIAGKAPDKQHPLGHGRIEYLSAMIISLIILYAGITSLVEAVKKIMHPSEPEYSAVSLIIVAVAIVVKILLGRYVKKTGKRVNSDSLVNSGEDAKLDAVISASTLVAAVIYLGFEVSLEAWLGALISCVIIKSGTDMLLDTLSQIIGERADSDTSKKIKKIAGSFEGVSGVYDLVLHAYGPETYTGSFHIEIPDTMTAEKIANLEEEIVVAVYRETGVIITGISIYSRNTGDPEITAMQARIREAVMKVEYVIQMHGFNYNKETKLLRFDVVVSFDAPDRNEVWKEVQDIAQGLYPDAHLVVTMDADMSD
ncbi:MAG: cation diffusion facilitator family transporter [Eubacterium sp.]|jgi:cation diffusion facilitator family transporter